MSLLALIIGFVLLIKGSFRFFGRNISPQRGRLIGLALMTPFTLSFCYSTVQVYGALSATIAETGTLDEETTMQLMQELQDVNNPITQAVATVDFFTLIIALGVTGYLLATAPTPTEQLETSASTHTPPPNIAAAPSVMTPAEAAFYLRVSESDVLRLIDEGKLPAARINSDYRIAKSAIDDMLNPDHDPFSDA